MASRMLLSFHHCRRTKHSHHCIKGLLRSLLTQAYRCDQNWLERLKSPVLSQVNFNEFSIQVLEKLDKHKNASLIDIDILANKLHEMEGPDEEERVQTVLTKFQRTQLAYPVCDSVNHAIIRNYLQLGKTDRLISMMKDKLKFGIFPDNQAACILLDYFITKGDFKNAAQIGYEIMLQEDFSHPTSYLLTLFSCVKYYFNSEELEKWEPEVVDPEEEVQFIPISYIHVPYYDDHFDIKDERFLLGKTLYYVGKELDNVVGRSLQLIGLGLYEKFVKANGLLEKWITEVKDEAVVTEDALKRYSGYLSEASTRDPDAPEKEQGDITMDDEIMKLRVTPQEKDDCIGKLEKMQGQLKDNRISQENIEAFVENYVKAELPKNEEKDIEILKSNYENWSKKRTELLEIQMHEYMVKKKEEEILKKFIDLQQKEELFTFFEKENEMDLAGEKVKELDKVDERKELDYVEAPGERGVQKIKKKKK